MKSELIFVGNIKKIKSCKFNVTHEMGCSLGFFIRGDFDVAADLYKTNAVFIKVSDCGGYVDIDDINSIFDLFKIKRSLDKTGGFIPGRIIIPDAPGLFSKEGDLYVDSSTLAPYKCYEPTAEDKEEISLWQLKKQRKASITRKVS